MAWLLAAAWWAAALCNAVVLADESLGCRAEFTNFVLPKAVPPELTQQAQSLATNIMRTISETLRADFNYVNSLLDLLVTIPKSVLDGRLFHRFTLPGSEGGFYKGTMKSTSFVPRVLHNNTDPAFAGLYLNRTALEADPWWTSQESYKSLALKLRNSSRYVINSIPKVRAEASEYYPILYVEPVAGNEIVVGLDNGDGGVRIRSGKVAEQVAGRVVTAPLRLGQSKYEQYGFIMWNPLFHDVSDPSMFTLPQRNASVPRSELWPAAHVTAAYVVQDLLQSALGIPALSALPGADHAGASLITLFFQKLGYPDVDPTKARTWDFMAGFSSSLQIQNTTFMESFNKNWKNNRTAQKQIVAHDVFCGNISVDDAGSEWHAVLAVDYGCQEGEYLVEAGVPGERLSRCAPCPRGLYCSGLAGGDPFEVPAGYFALPWDDAAESASVYQCRPAAACPGGQAGMCAGGRIGVPCSRCLEGHGWTGQQCAPCSASGSVAWAFALSGFFLALIAMYYGNRAPLAEKPSIFMALSCAAGVGITLLQVVSILRLVPIEWPESSKSAMQGSSWIMLDGETISLDCVIGPTALPRYLATVLVFPATLICLAFLKIISIVIPPRFQQHRWAWPETFNSMGLVLRMAFTTMCNIALMPFMCYSHPNGKRSVLKYTGVICGMGDHSTMEAFGVLLILLCAAFVAILLAMSWLAPRWSALGGSGLSRLRAFRFLLVPFRGDVWWYGTFLVLRGFALSLPVALATDSPIAQLLALTLILLTSLALQVFLWPWKVPLVNALDAIITFLLIMVIAWGIFYAPHVQEGTLSELDRLGVVVFAVLLFCICVVLLWAGYFLLRRKGGLGNFFQLAVGKTPNVTVLSSQLHRFASELSAHTPESTKELLQALSVYDVLSVASVVTIMGNLVGDPERQLSRRVIYMSKEGLPVASKEAAPSKPSNLVTV